MSNFLYVIILILVVIWGTAFFIYEAGYSIHILLIIAFLPLIIRVIRGRDFNKKKLDKKSLDNKVTKNK